MCCNRARPPWARPLPSSGASVAGPTGGNQTNEAQPRRTFPQTALDATPPDQPGCSCKPWDPSADQAPVSLTEIYRGPAPASEPETANAVWLLDRFPTLGYFIDVHSFGELILYNWGDDDDQTSDPSMNFHNPAFDGERGVPDATPGGDPERYREYLPPPTWTPSSRWATRCARPSERRTGGTTPSSKPWASTPRREAPTTTRTPAVFSIPRAARSSATRSNGGRSGHRSPRVFTRTTRTWCRSSRR